MNLTNSNAEMNCKIYNLKTQLKFENPEFCPELKLGELKFIMEEFLYPWMNIVKLQFIQGSLHILPNCSLFYGVLGL